MFCLTCWRRKIVDTENEKQEDENNHITEAEGQTEVYYNVQREFTSRHPQPQQDNEYSEVHREVTEDCESEYADANAIFGLNSHEVVTMATYSVVRPLSERHVKVKQAQVRQMILDTGFFRRHTRLAVKLKSCGLGRVKYPLLDSNFF